MSYQDEESKVLIGMLGAPVGLKGEIRLNLYAGDSVNLGNKGIMLYMSCSDRELSRRVLNLRMHKNRPVILIDGIDDRNAAENIRGSEVYLDESDFKELPEGEFYIRDLIGLRAVNAKTGDVIGIVKDYIQNPAQGLFSISTADDTDVLIPDVAEFINDIDLDEGVMKVALIEGLV